MGHNFVMRELPRQGVGRTALFLGPITVSSGSVFVFLISEGFDLPLAPQLYPVALLGVATAALWGWRGLEPDVKMRLVRLIRDRFVRKAVA